MKGYNTEKWAIKQWAGKLGWTLSGREPTHLLLDGGILHVPMHEYQEGFLRRVGEQMDDGIENFIAEKRTPIFIMHADLDILEPSGNEMTLDRFGEWAKDIQHIMKEFFHEAWDGYKPGINDPRIGSFKRLSMLVCCAPSKYDVVKNKGMWTKTGYHLIWPWTYVDSAQAITLRSAFIQYFQKKYGLRAKENTWEDVFDLTVYTQNGLRMVGSDKLERCPSCKGKKAAGGFCKLSICDGERGKYPSNRVYHVVKAYNYNGVKSTKLLEKVTESGVVEVKMTSIRSMATSTTPMKNPDWFDPLFFHDEQANHQSIFNPTPSDRKKRREALGQMPDNLQGARELGISTAPKLSKADVRLISLQKWLRDPDLPRGMCIPQVYHKTDIVDLVEKTGKNESTYYLARTDSFFCLHKGDEHTSNNIYFLITRFGLYQKCFSSKCKNWCSSPYQLPPTVLKAFFPIIHQRQMKAHQICRNNNNIHDTVELSIEERIALQEAKREMLEVKRARNQSRKKAQFEERFKSKRG